MSTDDTWAQKKAAEIIVNSWRGSQIGLDRLDASLVLSKITAALEEAHKRGKAEAGTGSVLDVACGSKMFWFDREDSRAIFLDKRRESHILKDISSKGGIRHLVIDPDIQGDFTALSFEDNSFPLVVFDPPHLIKNGESGYLAKKYGKLGTDWKEVLAKGFDECFRVLMPGGTLVFKWNENDIPVSTILALTNEKPLFGNKCGKASKTHWLVFQKPWIAPIKAQPAAPDEVSEEEFIEQARMGSLQHLGMHGYSQFVKGALWARRKARSLPASVAQDEKVAVTSSDSSQQLLVNPKVKALVAGIQEIIDGRWLRVSVRSGCGDGFQFLTPADTPSLKFRDDDFLRLNADKVGFDSIEKCVDDKGPNHIKEKLRDLLAAISTPEAGGGG